MITLITIGKLSKEYQELLLSYKKKISFFTKLKIIELKEVNHKNIEVQKQKETQKILEVIPKNDHIFLCSLNGQHFSSKGFSSFFTQNARMTFVIGGSHGVNEKLFKSSEVKKICFSNMTFPHQLFRIMLLEQIFRAFSITNNMKYHK